MRKIDKELQTERPILIGGCGSSGTTLLRSIVNQHNNIYCGPEIAILNKRILYKQSFDLTKSYFERYLANGLPTEASPTLSWLPSSTSSIVRKEMRFCQIPEKYGLSNHDILKIARRCENYKQFVECIFKKILISEGKIRWAEKTPTNCYCIGEFLNLFPLGCYIHVVRDGRDVVPSLEKRGWSIEASVRRWMYDTATGIKYRDHPRYFEIKYEDLVLYPEETICQLFTFLNESPINLSSFQTKKNDQEEEQGFHKTWLLHPSQPISANSTHKWKNFSDGYKLYLQMAFRFTYFTKQSTNSLGLFENQNGNNILDMLGYDSSDEWETNPSRNWKFIRYYYLREKRGRRRFRNLDYFTVKLF